MISTAVKSKLSEENQIWKGLLPSHITFPELGLCWARILLWFGFQTPKAAVSWVFAGPAEPVGQCRARVGGAGAVKPVWPSGFTGQTGGTELPNCSHLPPLEFQLKQGRSAGTGASQATFCVFLK